MLPRIESIIGKIINNSVKKQQQQQKRLSKLEVDGQPRKEMGAGKPSVSLRSNDGGRFLECS